MRLDMKKIKILHHSKTVGMSGTDRTAALFCQYLDKNKYDVYLLYREGDSANNRLDIVKGLLGPDKVIPYRWVPGKRTRQPPYPPEQDNFFEVVSQINPDIAHFHCSGYHEWPILKWLVPNSKIITTNIFGYIDAAGQADKVVYISEYNRGRAVGQGEKDGPVVFNPIERPTFLDKQFCRSFFHEKYGVPKSGLLGLRVGRPDNPEQISLKAFSEVLKSRSDIHYLIVGPCAKWHHYAKGIPNVHFIDQIVDDHELAILHNATDIYLHARNDGEICSTAIQQAMMYSLPIISHRSRTYNGQVEMLDGVGYCVNVDDFEQYAQTLLSLINDPKLRHDIGQKAYQKAISNYEAGLVTRKLEKIYDQVLQ